MMVQPFRIVLRGGMTDDGGNSLVPSPIKTDDGAAISRRIARWKSQPEVTDGGRLRCKLSARDTKRHRIHMQCLLISFMFGLGSQKDHLLFCYEGEALVSQDLQVALLLQPVSNALFVAIAKLEFLVNQAAFFEEFVQTALRDVLNHLLVE